MNTPAHIVFSLAALGPARAATYPLAIVAGALLPDLAMMFFYGWHKAIGTAESAIWSQHYYESGWQAVFDLGNSIPLIAVAMLYCYWRGKTALVCLLASMFCHCVLDLMVHHDDGHRHFYPFLNWRFVSPVSYWDPSHYGNIVAMIEVVLVVLLSVWLWRATKTLVATEGRAGRLRFVLILTNLIYLCFFFYVARTWM